MRRSTRLTEICAYPPFAVWSTAWSPHGGEAGFHEIEFTERKEKTSLVIVSNVIISGWTNTFTGRLCAAIVDPLRFGDRITNIET